MAQTTTCAGTTTSHSCQSGVTSSCSEGKRNSALQSAQIDQHPAGVNVPLLHQLCQLCSFDCHSENQLCFTVSRAPAVEQSIDDAGDGDYCSAHCSCRPHHPPQASSNSTGSLHLLHGCEAADCAQSSCRGTQFPYIDVPSAAHHDSVLGHIRLESVVLRRVGIASGCSRHCRIAKQSD